MKLLEEKMREMIGLSDDNETREFLGEIIKDFRYIMTIEEFLHQKMFKHVQNA